MLKNPQHSNTTNEVEDKHQDFQIYKLEEGLQPQPEEDWIIQDLLAKKWVMILYGEPGCKKTWTALDLGASVCQGDKWLDFRTVQSKVLLVDEESGASRVLRRSGRVLRGHCIEHSENFIATSLHGFNLTTTKGIEDFNTLLNETKPDLVIMDLLSDFMLGAEENSVKEVNPVLHVLRDAAERHNCGIIAIHHVNRNGGYRGSSAFKGKVDVMLLAKSEQGSDVITFSIEKTRDLCIKPFAAKTYFEDPARFYLMPCDSVVSKEKPLGDVDAWILKFLHENGDSTIKQMQGCVSICSEGHMRIRVFELAKKGLIERVNPSRCRQVEGIYGVKVSKPETIH